MTTLDKKLVRDLLRMRGQALTIALVIACGIASYVTLKSAYASLLWARDGYYGANRFADVFVHLKRAPRSLAPRIEAIPGVAIAETRLVEVAMLPLEGLPEPAAGRIVSLPSSGQPRLNSLFLRSGRMVETGRADEAIVLESFALAHGLEPGSTMPAVINGVRKQLRVVGVALSPEYVIAMGGAQALAPDDLRFAVLWMDEAAIAPAFQMEGAFDDVALRLQHGASERQVKDELDALLRPYGGLGAVDQRHQLSSYFVDSELGQLEAYATIAPLIFLSVAAFLVNVVLARLVHLQRPQIATLKALGYRRSEIGGHYVKLVLVIVAVGAAAGISLGAWLGRGMLALYARYYHFPAFEYRLGAQLVVTSVLVSLGSALAGAFFVVRRVVALPPAEAMQPEAPPTYRPSLLERVGAGRLLSGAGRMVMREMLRRPVRLAMSCVGIALGIAVVLIGAFMPGAV